ncbi:DUF4062 domain-containing protein [Salegentibacter maritimus]|uniref:DUF4062 domain-containing protein n=1 Tax=Salegentibacter maritimus TaxID=2794347 RepID=UPI0018E4916F|nr:DUF4062 domain-containing protein [Salegentibacter maritimus]MBI6115880.1 DUF4062 domain-containing protein [Salegentibacter maritimus]
MAKPRVFISSTFYDLRQVRADLDFFIEQMGYDPVRNEEGDIPYGKDEALEEYCYKEIKNIDILVCIIGGRFGSESKSNNRSSITQMELKAALSEGKQVYTFIDANVLSEYETYLINKEGETKYRYVDDKRVYEFIEEIKSLKANNIIKGFETASDIVKYLREQMAGLFQRFLEEQTRVKEVSLIKGLEKTASTLNKLVNFLSDENKDQTDEINKILMISHPLVEELKAKLDVPYNFYFEGLDDVKQLLKARGYSYDEELPFGDPEPFHEWSKNHNRKDYKLTISKEVFEEDGRLRFVRKSDWKEEFVSHEVVEKEEDDDLPF